MLINTAHSMALPHVSEPNPLALTRGNASISLSRDDPAYRQKMEQAAEQFEGLFISQMLNSMQQANQPIKDTNGESDSSSDGLLAYANRVVADTLASQRAFGIAECLIAQMLPPQTLPSQDQAAPATASVTTHAQAETVPAAPHLSSTDLAS
ncbi:hypothetical protein QS306_03785 [Paraburkholderia bonniea]|uniref:hypothetical protein n=1 Tax=Paraburkholderia bonniea TaxID=2152891 RepID=UPI0012909400|nr:hypothetical protein [Paraburkholderia bonniea]WJF90796.1 hypothetical protein QS306_03785 [Paraburkholderia bonniea]WJF94110.1 hypothetical protein QS308_03785 [Paraburkholderia bonniea]